MTHEDLDLTIGDIRGFDEFSPPDVSCGATMNEAAGHLDGAPALAQYARSRRAAGLLFLAGVSSRQLDNSVKGASRGTTGALEFEIQAQTEGCIENLAAALRSENLCLDDLVDVTVFLVNMADYGGFNTAWNRFFGPSGPTRTTVAVHQLPDPQLAIELKAIANCDSNTHQKNETNGK